MREDSVIKELDYKNHIIKIYPDDMLESPRQWDNLGKMICFHNRYNLGDKHDFSIDEFKEFISKGKDIISLPLYLYDHSGITMNTTGFFCLWDSGQVGRIYCTKEQALKEFGGKYMTRKLKDKAKEVLLAEVETYDKYLRGDVVGYVVCDEAGEPLDSCWGYYDIEDATEEAKSIVDYEVEEKAKEEKEEKEFKSAHPLAFMA